MSWPLSLGDLIDLVAGLPADTPIVLVIGKRRLRPTTAASYRGWYEHLALGFEEGQPLAACQLRQALDRALYNYHEGYKGGSYLARRSTPVWASNWGEVSDRAIVGLRRGRDGAAALVTAK